MTTLEVTMRAMTAYMMSKHRLQTVRLVVETEEMPNDPSCVFTFFRTIITCGYGVKVIVTGEQQNQYPIYIEGVIVVDDQDMKSQHIGYLIQRLHEAADVVDEIVKWLNENRFLMEYDSGEIDTGLSVATIELRF